MTNKEAIEKLELYKSVMSDLIKVIAESKGLNCFDFDMEPFDIAIESLKLECYGEPGDIPSYDLNLEQARVEVRKLRKIIFDKKAPSDTWSIRDVTKAINKLSDDEKADAVSNKYGKWIIKTKDDENCKYYWYECSECHERPLKNLGQDSLSEYCPHCGAEMIDTDYMQALY